MLFNNLKLDKIVVHEVFQKGYDGPVHPRLGTSLEVLEKNAVDVFCSRVANALGAGSKCVEMALMKVEEGSVCSLTHQLINAPDNDFIIQSQHAPTLLTQAQTSTGYPGGLMIVFNGTVSSSNYPYVGYLKAEPQNGFRQIMDKGKSVLEFLNKLFLTPDSKVYKIGMFVDCQNKEEDAPPYRCFLFDSNITKKESSGAAAYFYQGFLGLTHLVESAQTTRDFVMHTRKFISKLEISEEEKFELRTALVTYVKIDQSTVISTGEFAKRYLPDLDMRDEYESYCSTNNIPASSFTKDLSECGTLLTNRTVKFAKNLKLVGPAESLGELVKIVPIEGENEGEQWTQITLKAKFLGEF